MSNLRCTLVLLSKVSKLLNLPEEAALYLRQYEVGLIISWSQLAGCLTLNLSNTNNSQDNQQELLGRITFYNQQVCTTGIWSEFKEIIPEGFSPLRYSLMSDKTNKCKDHLHKYI